MFQVVGYPEGNITTADTLFTHEGSATSHAEALNSMFPHEPEHRRFRVYSAFVESRENLTYGAQWTSGVARNYLTHEYSAFEASATEVMVTEELREEVLFSERTPGQWEVQVYAYSEATATLFAADALRRLEAGETPDSSWPASFAELNARAATAEA